MDTWIPRANLQYALRMTKHNTHNTSSTGYHITFASATLAFWSAVVCSRSPWSVCVLMFLWCAPSPTHITIELANQWFDGSVIFRVIREFSPATQDRHHLHCGLASLARLGDWLPLTNTTLLLHCFLCGLASGFDLLGLHGVGLLHGFCQWLLVPGTSAEPAMPFSIPATFAAVVRWPSLCRTPATIGARAQHLCNHGELQLRPEKQCHRRLRQHAPHWTTNGMNQRKTQIENPQDNTNAHI